MFDIYQLRELVIAPTLKKLGMYSLAAENLLVGTAIQESRGGTYLKQIGGGPAVGLYQIEPATAFDVLKRYLVDIAPFVNATHFDISKASDSEIMRRIMVDPVVSTAVCRIKYHMIPKPLPDADDLPGLGAYWKQYYNTPAGAGTVEEFIKNYDKFSEYH